jgi:phage gp29-like protein
MAEETVSKKPVIDEVATIRKDIDVFAGYLTRLENPDPILRTEAAGKGLKLYDEVDRDAHAGSVLQTRYLAVVGKEWDVVPAESAKSPGRPSTNSKEKAVADFVSSVLENCNFDQARGELLQGILYGVYVCEIIWTVKENAVVIKRLIGKHPRRFTFTPDREMRLLTLQNMIDGEALPPMKFINFTFGDSDNPFGKGLGRRLWWAVWFKKHGIKYWAVFLEKFGMPTAVGKYPPSTTTPEQKKTLLDAIDAIQSETGITIPNDMAIEFLEAHRAGTVTHESFETFMDRQISKAVLGQTATTEGTAGKLGNEKAQEEVRKDILEADADLLDACLNETLIRWIVDYNFPGVTEYPKLKTFASPKPDLDKQSEIDERNVKAGVKIPMRYFYETYGYPVPEKGEEIAVASAPANTQVAAGDKPEFAEGADFTPEQQALEGLIDAILPGGSSTLAENERQILNAIESATTFQEALENVLALYPNLNVDALAGILDRSLFNAELYGRFTVTEETA